MFFNDLRYILIKRHNTYTTAVVYSPYSYNYDSENLHYIYKVGDKEFVNHEARPTKPGLNKIISQNGIPVLKNYEYLVWYNPDHPDRSIIDLEYPVKSTVLEIQKNGFVSKTKAFENYEMTPTANYVEIIMMNGLRKYFSDEEVETND